MSNLAINDAGEVLAFDGTAWKPATIAQNDQGAKLVFDGSAWQPLDKLVGQAKGSQAQGRSDALAGAVASGATFGTADEIGASVRAALPDFSNWMMSGPALQRDESIGGSPKAQTVSNAPTYEQRREEELARMRGQSAANKEAYPVLTTAGEIGGNVLGTAALSMVPGARALVTGGGASGLVGNTIRGGLTGMALGGAQGFAEGEGGFDNRAANAVMPALLGGVIGAAAPTLAKGAEFVYDRAAPRLLRYIADKGERFVPKVQPQSLSAAAPDGSPGIAQSGPLTDAVDALNNAATSIENKAAAKIAGPAAAEVVDPAAEAAARKQAADEALRTVAASMAPKPAPGATLLGTVGEKVGKAARGAGQAADSLENQIATKRLAQVISKQSAVDAIEARGRELGDGFMLADANTDLGRTLFAQQANSGKAADIAGKNLLERNQQTGRRFIEKSGIPGAPDPSKAQAYLEEFRRVEGGKIYDPVLRSGQPPKVTPEMEALMQRPSIKKAFDTVDKMAAEEGRVFSEAERLHRVKRALNQNAEAGIRRGEAIDRDLVDATAREWESALWKANPEIAKADAEFAKIAGLHEDWFKRGQAFAARGRGEAAQNASPEAIAEHLRDATPTQKLAFQAGASSEIRNTASFGGDATRRLAKSMGDGEAMVARLTEIYGPERARQMLASGEAERVFAETFRNTMRGSQTAERTVALARDADLMPPAIRNGGDLAQVMSWLKDTAAKLDTPTEAARQRLAKVLTTMNRDEQKAALDEVRRYLARQRQTPFKPGVAGSAASTAAPSQR